MKQADEGRASRSRVVALRHSRQRSVSPSSPGRTEGENKNAYFIFLAGVLAPFW
jgi:hypothetical protein